MSLSDQYQYPTDDSNLRLGKVSATPDTNTTKQSFFMPDPSPLLSTLIVLS